MLLQIDGSHHRWLEDRGPRFVLLLAVNDATGMVANALFRPEEDTRGYFLLMEGIIRRYGIPWPSTATATVSSSSMASPATSPNRWVRPSSPGPWGNWALNRSLPVRHRPRDGWNAWPAPSRTGWSANSGWLELPPSTRPTPCCGTSSPASTTSSACLLNSPSPLIAPWTPPCIWNGSSVSSTCARWAGTTPSSTSCAPCSCFQPRTGLAMPGDAGAERRTAYGPA